MTGLPDCPNCDSAWTLEVAREEPHGVRVCLCTVCAKECRVNAHGRILPDIERDISGNVIYE